MSIWADIQDRSCGLKDRKEDKIFPDVVPIAGNITFAGTLNTSFPNPVYQKGKMYILEDNLTIDGVTYHNGDLIIYTGHRWEKIGASCDNNLITSDYNISNSTSIANNYYTPSSEIANSHHIGWPGWND